jgi:outer membrane protein with beta-barrel domain
LSAVPVLAQPFSAGIKAGVPLTDFLNATQGGIDGDFFTYKSPTQRYIIGATAELRLPRGFSVEVDALYRHLSYHAYNPIVPGSDTSDTTGSNWEFPLPLKYRFRFPLVRPFLDGGVAWDTLTGLRQTVTSIRYLTVPATTTTTTTSNPAELKQSGTMGIVLGGGVDIHALFLHISPEIRFTRWASAQINATFLNSNLNQAEFLVGFTF